MNKLYFCRLLEVNVLIEQNIYEVKNGFESDLIVSIKDEMLWSLIKLIAKDEFNLTFKEEDVKIYEDRLYWELINIYGKLVAVKELSWKGESVRAKLVPSETLFLKSIKK